MPARQAPSMIPTHWLMLDARLGDGMLAAARALPPRSAIIVRPYAMSAAQRHPSMLRALRAIARARGHRLIHSKQHRAGFDGVHNAAPAYGMSRRSGGLRSMAVHNPQQAAKARRLRVDAVLISPVYATRSHIGAKAIGPRYFAQLAKQSGQAAAIALGGMTPARFRRLRYHGAKGWAAIDAWQA